MSRSYNLRSHDVCVLLQLLLQPEPTYRELAAAVGLSLGEAHNSRKRLEAAGLVLNGATSVNKTGAVEFLSSGVPYVFPGRLGPETRGIPTAHSAPPLSGEIRSSEVIVWPSVRGDVRGWSLEPLCPCASEAAESNPDLYRLLALVDGIRIGRARERKLARRYIQSAFGLDDRL